MVTVYFPDGTRKRVTAVAADALIRSGKAQIKPYEGVSVIIDEPPALVIEPPTLVVESPVLVVEPPSSLEFQIEKD